MTSIPLKSSFSGLNGFCYPDSFRLFAIAVLVIGAHAGWLGWLSIKDDEKRPAASPPRLHVQTIALSQPQPQKIVEVVPAPPIVVEEAAPPVPKEEEVAKVEVAKMEEPLPAPKEVPVAQVEPAAPAPKKIDVPKEVPAPVKPAVPAPKKVVQKPVPATPPKPVVKEKPKPPVKPVPEAAKPAAPSKASPPPVKAPPVKDAATEAAAARKKQLLADAKKSIENMGAVPRTIKPGNADAIAIAAPPSALTALHVDALSGPANGNTLEYHYDHELVNRLKRLLRLPQYGDVEIKLTLQRSGKVAKLVITSAGNQANKEHVEKIVPTMQFPPFGNGFAGEEQHTFRIILSHERAY